MLFTSRHTVTYCTGTANLILPYQCGEERGNPCLQSRVRIRYHYCPQQTLSGRGPTQMEQSVGWPPGGHKDNFLSKCENNKEKKSKNRLLVPQFTSKHYRFPMKRIRYKIAKIKIPTPRNCYLQNC
jgi:hypothetical protein